MTTAGSSRLGPFSSMALVLLALVGLIYAVMALPLDALGELRLRQLSVWAIVAAVLLHAVYLALSAEVWRRMVRMVAGRKVAYADAYMQMAAVAVGKYVPGKVWGFVARVAQLRRDNIPAHQSVAGSVVEQILVIAGAGIVIIGAALVAFAEYRVYVIAFGVLLVAALVLASRNVPALLRRFGRSREGDRPIQYARYSAPRLLLFSLAYAVLWFISGAILAIIYFATFGAAVTAEAVAAIVIANTVGFIAGFLAVFAPGGLGVREAATVIVLTPLLPVREVIVAAIALRALIVLFDGVNAVILLFGESRYAIGEGRGSGD